MTTPDIIIIGSGMGGATLAAALAPSGKQILILERGDWLADSPQARDGAAIFGGYFRSDEAWLDQAGQSFHPGNYYYPGGNTKFYGAVLLRYRAEDFAPLQHVEGRTPGWPIDYAQLEPWYGRAEHLYNVRGALGYDETEPPHSTPYPFGPVPDEPPVADLKRRLVRQGLNVGPVPLGVDIDKWLEGGLQTFDGFPNTRGGKMDAENCGLAAALKHPNVTLQRNAEVVRLHSDGHRITAVEYLAQGKPVRIAAPVICLCMGAVKSAALLLTSGGAAHPQGLANSSGQVGRNFMNHNISAVLAYSPFRRNTSVYEKTIQFNDWYLKGGPGDRPLGNVQMLGKVTGPILAAETGWPLWLAHHVAEHSMHLMTMSEDLPNPDSRVLVKDGKIVLHWQRSNFGAHIHLTNKLKLVLRRAGWPVVVSKTFEKKSPSHQCGTARMGTDPATSVVDVNLKAHDLDNLYIVDASVLPTSAAVNPSLTIPAPAFRAGAHIGAL
ncbi:MAG: GMC family oxidoreductase [Candidatus Saccharibacteria bacterium]|nr:GMC family oxidoreductase [Pseudorhodobacter sp.]